MSTRFGKRFHNSQLSENVSDKEIPHIEIKTRSKRNMDHQEHLAEKKRKYYVKYPSEEATDDNESNIKSTKVRKSTRNTLKERNVQTVDSDAEMRSGHIERKHTRRTKKNELEDVLLNHTENSCEKNDKKKRKKKIINENKLYHEQEDNNAASKKKSHKKKNKKKSSSIIVQNIDNEHCKPLNGSELSVDSFHSAAGSPKVKEDNIGELNITRDESTPKNKQRVNDMCVKQISPTISNSSTRKKPKNVCNKLNPSLASSPQVNKLNDTDSGTQDENQSDVVNICDKLNVPEVSREFLSERSLRKRKSSLKNASEDNVDKCTKMNSSQKFKNSNNKKRKLSAKLCDTMFNKYEEVTLDSKSNVESTFDKLANLDTIFDKNLDTTFDKSSKLDTTFDKINKINTTLDKCNKTNTPMNKTNTTFDKIDKTNTTIDKADKTNTTFDKIDETNRTFDKIDKTNTTFDKIDKTNITFDKIDKNDTTIDKIDKTNATFDKIDKTNTKFDKIEKTNTTFDKIDKTITTFHEIKKKSAQSTSDNISEDTSNDSLISSDTSKSSHISVTSDESHSENLLNNTPLLVESSMEELNISKSTMPADSLSRTPLKREGTFTKDSPKSPIVSKVTVAKSKTNNKTPTRRKSLPSPGCTPFPVSKSLSKDKSMMNITHSIEKSRRSSLAEMMPRNTKVMFCSPSNNPVVTSQMKRKIIKSSLKGSNKSFIFEDTGASSPARAGRKRSQTQEGAEPRAKRSRLLDERAPPLRVRSRTLSATAKIPDSTAGKKVETPSSGSESRPARTRLPNFAALHQKQFAKMESLDECQERRARRAKQLLTPTGAAAFLQRISPKENEAPKQEPKQFKSETPTMPKPAPTLGYSRFGFKLHLDNNPFSFTAKTEAKPKVPKLSRQGTAPSLAGTTLSRREAARQVVMQKSVVKRAERQESRTVIRGVRTNRRFELQMKMRNIHV